MACLPKRLALIVFRVRSICDSGQYGDFHRLLWEPDGILSEFLGPCAPSLLGRFLGSGN